MSFVIGSENLFGECDVLRIVRGRDVIRIGGDRYVLVE